MGLVITVREAATSDATRLLALHRSVLEERDYFITLPQEFSNNVYGIIQHIRACARQANSVFLVAEIDGEIKGFLTIRGGTLSRMMHTGKLEIMVDRHARGQGVGRMLMDECLAWAANTPDIEKIGLSVFAHNDRAVKLYQALGFQEEGRREKEYRMRDGRYCDDILMYLWV